MTHRALIHELTALAPRWNEPSEQTGEPSASTGSLVQQAMSVPGEEPFLHAALHLGIGTAST